MEIQTNNYLTSVFTLNEHLTAEECLQVRQLSKAYDKVQGIAQDQLNEKYRKSATRFITVEDSTSWIFQKMQQAIIAANRGFQFELRGFGEPLQVAEYKDGGHYTWHLDIGPGITSGRKLSASVQLTDGSEYEGGDLEFQTGVPLEIPRSIGSVIVFPSYLPHRVNPVIKGTRYSLVLWAHGTPFR